MKHLAKHITVKLDNHDHDEFFTALKNNLSQVTYLLKQNQKKWNFKRDYLYQKPWYLVIGPEGAGKTSVFQNSEVSSIQALSKESALVPKTCFLVVTMFVVSPSKAVQSVVAFMESIT